jgi:ferredoxin
MMGACVSFGSMPVIRFVREGRDVECYPGENLREVALRERLELYGLKGQLGNCGGCGQCSTCFVSVVDENNADALTERTPVEDSKLRRRPPEWRLACQALVEKSVMVLTRPQMRLPDAETRLAAARQAPLPMGPTAWPASPDDELESEDEPDGDSSVEKGSAATADEEG